MSRSRAGVAAVVGAVTASLLASAAPAPAQDFLLCRKRDHLADRGGKTYRLGKGNDFFNAGPGEDRIYGGPGDDVINGGRGNDVVRGGPGNDIVCGGIGRDRVGGDSGRDEVLGEEGDDRVKGGAGKDYIGGQAGKDRLYGYGVRGGRKIADGADRLEGSYRPDLLLLGGKDVAFGGIDEDVLRSMTPRIGARLIDGGDQDDLIVGTNGADLITDPNGNNVLRGRGGDDRIVGGGALDRIYGGGGDDRIHGGIGGGNDDLFGGRGTDRCTGIYRAFLDPSCERRQTIDSDKRGWPPSEPAAPFTGAAPIASASGECQARAPGRWSFPAPPSRQVVLVRFSTTGRQASVSSHPYFDLDLEGRDTSWVTSPGVPGAGTVGCHTFGTYTVDFYDPPTAPVTFSGARLARFPADDDELVFRVPEAGSYFADVVVQQGRVEVHDGLNTVEYSASGSFPLGELQPGALHYLRLTSRGGEVQTRWTITIRPA